MNPHDYTQEEMKLFRRLNTPQRIQDFLNTLTFDFEDTIDSYLSPRDVIKHKRANCLTGALFASACLEFHGAKPLLLDLRVAKKVGDDDHVVAVFKKFDCFGAISKTNHGVLRYREPVYKTLHELVLSYFHEYFLNSNGLKTLRQYSELLDLTKLNKLDWRTSGEKLVQIEKALEKTKHHNILSPEQIKNLRKADRVEREVGKITEHKNK